MYVAAVIPNSLSGLSKLGKLDLSNKLTSECVSMDESVGGGASNVHVGGAEMGVQHIFLMCTYSSMCYRWLVSRWNSDNCEIDLRRVECGETPQAPARFKRAGSVYTVHIASKMREPETCLGSVY